MSDLERWFWERPTPQDIQKADYMASLMATLQGNNTGYLWATVDIGYGLEGLPTPIFAGRNRP